MQFNWEFELESYLKGGDVGPHASAAGINAGHSEFVGSSRLEFRFSQKAHLSRMHSHIEVALKPAPFGTLQLSLVFVYLNMEIHFIKLSLITHITSKHTAYMHQKYLLKLLRRTDPRVANRWVRRNG